MFGELIGKLIIAPIKIATMPITALTESIEDQVKYIDDVLEGTIPACKYLKLAVQRHLDDIQHGQERGLYFDTDAAQKAIDFIQNSKLEPWQQFSVWVIFGWMNADGTRLFNVAYNEEARKNGKSTKAAAIGLLGLGFDGINRRPS